jgi:hypothetical protein
VTDSLVVFAETPALLGGMTYPRPDTDWQALHDRGFHVVVRLHPGDYDATPLAVLDVPLVDLHGGAVPEDPDGDREHVWEAARIIAEAVLSGTGVLIHCVGGTGRTGTVAACTLRLLSRSADEAVAIVRAHRREWPESPWQEQVVRSASAAG